MLTYLSISTQHDPLMCCMSFKFTLNKCKCKDLSVISRSESLHQSKYDLLVKRICSGFVIFIRASFFHTWIVRNMTPISTIITLRYFSHTNITVYYFRKSRVFYYFFNDIHLRFCKVEMFKSQRMF